MKTLYTDMDIQFTLEGRRYYALNIIFERFTRTIPSHSHGNGCYEIHYIPYGYGKAFVNGQYYDITPNTLYVTGPHVEHAQSPIPEDPMQEYCIYLKKGKTAKVAPALSCLDLFEITPFWIGQDNQGIHGIMKDIFFELEHQYTGYMSQVELLLQQLLIHLVRNYEYKKSSGQHFSHSNLMDSKSVIIEEYFLYEYRQLSLEDLAARLRLSPRQTQRLLLEFYGKTFQQKKAQARMSAAAILLAEPSRSITSIADALGYSSAEHFSTAFRRFYHVSPREYRKKLT